ncbi:MAG: glycoside hydrolase family 31 protein, partial [Bacteroidota bacterium]|nr:glycoside hydrolase family 31 protein [Bacteroidota bacterium]
EGVKTILITEPFILKTSKTAANALQKNAVALDSLGNPGLIKDFYFGPAYLLDLFDGKAQDWFWNYYDKQIKIDVAGWWGDLGEPERHPSFLRHLNGKAWDVHNIYGQYWNKMISEKYKANYPAQRVFHLNRSGFAGSQRYGIFPWSGDVGRSWNGLKAQIPIMTIMGLSGIPYMHSDLGGFAAGVKDEELYTRWLQMGVFNPVFRPHGESIPSEPIFFNDTTQRIVKEYIRLRYRMVPYNYSIARNHNLTGDPLVRSLYWETNRKADFSNMDCYFWGGNLLVFPIYEKGQKFKKVFIPQGKWFNFTTDKIIEGGDTLMVSTSPEELPVLVKAGSFIPMTTPLSDMDQYNSNEYVVHYYADNSVANSSFTIYEDDGKDARAMAKGTYEIITLKCKTNPDKLQFLLQSNGGNYPGKPVSRSITLVLHHAQGKKIVVNGKTIRNIPFEQEKHSILRYVNYEEKPQVLKFNWNGKELN